MFTLDGLVHSTIFNPPINVTLGFTTNLTTNLIKRHISHVHSYQKQSISDQMELYFRFSLSRE